METSDVAGDPSSAFGPVDAVDPLRRHQIRVDHPVAGENSTHLLVCVGPNCAARKSVEMFEHAWGQLEQHRIAYYCHGGSVRLTQCGCLGSCDQGPSVMAYGRDERDLMRRVHLVEMTAASTFALAEQAHRRWRRESPAGATVALDVADNEET